MSRRVKIFSLLVLIVILVALAFFWNHYRTQENAPAPENTSVPEEQSFIDIEPAQDCSNECLQYQNDQEKYHYCRSVCGFTVQNGVSVPPTSADPELSKDYQLKDEAVAGQDIKKCQEIKDANIEKSCQSRVTEDMLDGQGSHGF